MAAAQGIKQDESRLNSKSGQDAAKLGMGLGIAGAITSLGASTLGAADSAAKVASTASKTAKTVADVSKGVKYAGLAADTINTAKDSDADWQDWTRIGLKGIGTIGGDLAGAGSMGVNSTVGNGPFNSMQSIKDLNKFGNMANVGSNLAKGAQAGSAGMGLYNAGRAIDKQGLNAQTGLQGMSAIGSGLSAGANYSDNQNFRDFTDYYNTGTGLAGFGMGLNNAINSGF
jgi:hypothetical protein